MFELELDFIIGDYNEIDAISTEAKEHCKKNSIVMRKNGYQWLHLKPILSLQVNIKDISA